MNFEKAESRRLAESSWASVEAPPAGAAVSPEQVAVPSDLLDGGEAVHLAIKPSLWTVVFGSVQWVAVAALVVAADVTSGHVVTEATGLPILQIAGAVVGLRVAAGMLQWGAKTYVLTNRRIMRISGVIKPEVWACPLVKIIGTEVTAAPHESLTRLGTIRFNVQEDPSLQRWMHIARPQEVHAQVRRAIERAFDGHC